MFKKILGLLLALSLALTPVQSAAFGGWGEPAPTTGFAAPFLPTSTAGYFYNQLSQNARVFYDALVKMYSAGTLKTGTEALDLAVDEAGAPIDNVQEMVAAHMIGRANLLSDYGAGRDAFYADYPGVFYVDFSNLTLRITESKDLDGLTVYHLYLGAGRFPTYRTEGMENWTIEQINAAEADYQAALNALVEVGRAQPTPREQVIAVHDYLTTHVTYRDEVAIAERNNGIADVGFIRTAYGALVKHEGVCESYTRAFKAAMDVLGIPCVMVSGVYRHDDTLAEAHIWNEVQIGDKWYGVDVTMDDPIDPDPPLFDTKGLDGFENQKYLLVGPDVMDVNHSPDGAMSPGGFEFSYPSLESEISTVVDGNGLLKVRYSTEAYDTEIIESGTYYVSFMGMDCVSMMNKGYYLILKNKYYDINSGWVDTDWYYFTPELYQGAFDSKNGETKFAFPHVEYVQFGVTTIPYPEIIPDKIPDLMFHGDISLLVDSTAMLHNEYGDFRAAPASLRGIPAYNRGSLDIGKEQHLTAYFNDILVTPEVYEEWCKPRYEDKPEGVSAPLAIGDDPAYDEAIRSATTDDFTLSARVVDKLLHTVRTDEKYQAPIKNVEISFTDTETVIELDYTANDEWIDDSVFYEFIIDGLVGAYSGKAPDCFGWVAAYPCAICAYRSRGFDYNTMAKPVLVADQDLSLDGWVDQNGNSWEDTPWGDSYKSKLMLVVEDTGSKDSHSMEEMVGEQGEDVLSALTYNINLTLCKLQWENLKDGMSVRIQLGFPDGFGPEDEGVTFKAYHFNKDPDTGEIISIEEIPCYITKSGLLIEVKHFSPFAICAVEKNTEAPISEKTVVLTSDVGGRLESVNAVNGIITLRPGETAAVSAIAEFGYSLDSAEGSGLVSGKNINASEFTISYEEIVGDMSVVTAKFVVAEVAQNEEGSAVVPEAVTPDAVVLPQGEIYTEIHKNLTLSVPEPNGAYTYNWYEVGGNGISDRLAATGSAVTFDYKEPGVRSYYVTVTATAGATSATSVPSNIVTVNVLDVHEHTYGDAYHHTAEGHYKVCTYVYPDGSPCLHETELEAHVPGENGACTVCGYGELKRGDLNGDRKVDVNDGIIMQKILAQLEDDAIYISRADLDGNPGVTVSDGIVMQKIIARVEE